MNDVGILYGHSVYFTAIWYVLRPFGIFYVFWYIFPVLVCCSKKNLATLFHNAIYVVESQQIRNTIFTLQEVHFDLLPWSLLWS
jgi:hypothetical protein